MDASSSAIVKSSMYYNELNKQKLLNAIRDGNSETAKELIAKGVDVNLILNDTLLHAAISLKRMDMLELLLAQPNINLNVKILKGQNVVTPLLWSLGIPTQVGGSKFEDKFIKRLIQAGCDVNMADKFKMTPLHLAITRPKITIAHELIKRGADVNARCYLQRTALHRAIEMRNLKAVCMLLYYNADVHIECNGHTPLSYAMYVGFCQVAPILINYYDFLYDYDVNYVIRTNETCIAFLAFTNAEVFKSVWPKLNPKEILNMSPSFLDIYLNDCRYTTCEWVECLHLILNSKIALDMIDCYKSNSILKIYNFLEQLQASMYYRNVDPSDRIGIIYTVLSLGIEVQKCDINKAVMLYGLGDEMQVLCYGTYSDSPIKDCYAFVNPLHAFTIDMETNFSMERVFQLFVNAENEWNRYTGKGVFMGKIFAHAVGFFSFPAYMKRNLVKLRPYPDFYIVMVGERLQKVPEFASLIELSRNQIHTYLIERFKFKQPYQMQDYVKKLKITDKIRDIILFRTPIY